MRITAYLTTPWLQSRPGQDDESPHGSTTTPQETIISSREKRGQPPRYRNIHQVPFAAMYETIMNPAPQASGGVAMFPGARLLLV